MSFIMTSYLPK